MDIKIDAYIEKGKEFLRDEDRRTYLILVASVLFAVLYLSLVIFPKTNALFKSSRSVREIRDNMELVKSRLNRMDALNKKLEKLRVEYKGYSKQLPSEKEMSRLLEDLAATAKKSDVKLISVTPLEADETDKTSGKIYYRSIPITVTAKAGYHQLGHFVNDLEQGGRFITIQDIKITNDPRTPRLHKIKLVIKAYVSVDDEGKRK